MTIQLRVLTVLIPLLWMSIPALAQRIYVANSAEATVSEIDIVQEREIARFRTWTGHATAQKYDMGSHNGPAPSRVVVDGAGNVYVLNRTWPYAGPPAIPPSLPILWKIRPTPKTGFATSHDGPDLNVTIDLLNNTEVLPLAVSFLPAPPGQPRQVDPAGIQEGRIEWGMEIGNSAVGSPDLGGLGRSLCIDLNGFLWVGIHNAHKYYKVDPSNGQIIHPFVSTIKGTTLHKPYGCVVDANGKLWSASSSGTVAEIDTTSGTSGALIDIRTHSPASNYGISAIRDCLRGTSSVYLSEQTGKTHIAFSTATPTVFSSSPVLKKANNQIIPNFTSYAIAVDLDGNIISGKYDASQKHALVVKYDAAGNVLWDTDTPPAGPTVSASDLHGMVIDSQNNVWAVHRNALSSTVPEGHVVKYRGTDGKHLKTIKIGREPYTYSNTLPPNCPCAVIDDTTATCQSVTGGLGIFNYSFTFFNKNPFAATATSMTVTAAPPITSVTPGPFTPVPPNGQATVTGTFTVANPVPGDRVCLDIKLFGDREGADFCCPSQQVCFTLPECKECLKAVGVFKCRLNGTRYLELTVTNDGLSPTTSVQVASNTPGVSVTPYSTPLPLQVGSQGTVIVAVNGAAPGQPISLTVSLNGPIDPLTGTFKWCCNSTITITYPVKPCWWWVDGDVIVDTNANGIRDGNDQGLANWTVTLTGETETRTTQTDNVGTYRFDDLPAGRYRLFVKPPSGVWRATVPKEGVHDVVMEGGTDRRYVFGFTRTAIP